MVDKTKNATIKVETILLEKLDFERQQKVSDAIFEKEGAIDSVKLNIEANIERHFNVDKTKLLLKFQLKINDADKTLKIVCRVVGVFVQTEDGSMNLEEFSRYNAPTFLLPYVRENVSSVTMKAGLPPLILPPMNMIKLLEDNPMKEIKQVKEAK